ncbi:hypothetical protein D3C87_1808850 [compost metagenome]
MPAHDQQRLAQGQHESAHRQFHADEKQQHDDAHFRQQRDIFRIVDQFKAGRAERHPRDDEAHQRRLAQPEKQQSQYRGNSDHHGDGDQRAAMGARFGHGSCHERIQLPFPSLRIPADIMHT